MSKPRRHRYYAYERIGAGLSWEPKQGHDYLGRYPHQLRYFQYVGFAGICRLMTTQERNDAQREGRELAAKSDSSNSGQWGALPLENQPRRAGE